MFKIKLCGSPFSCSSRNQKLIQPQLLWRLLTTAGTEGISFKNERGTLCFCRRAFDCSSFRLVSSLSSFCAIKQSFIERHVYCEHCGSLTQCACHHYALRAHIGDKSTAKESACGGGLSQIGLKSTCAREEPKPECLAFRLMKPHQT